jgi:hypothetical protein
VLSHIFVPCDCCRSWASENTDASGRISFTVHVLCVQMFRAICVSLMRAQSSVRSAIILLCTATATEGTGLTSMEFKHWFVASSLRALATKSADVRCTRTPPVARRDDDDSEQSLGNWDTGTSDAVQSFRRLYPAEGSKNAACSADRLCKHGLEFIQSSNGLLPRASDFFHGDIRP